MMFGRKRVQDATDYDKPFTLKVMRAKPSYSGQLKYVTVHAEQFCYPEPMVAAAQRWHDSGYAVWTYEPEPGTWTDDRTPAEDTSVNFDDLGVPSTQVRAGPVPRDISSPYDPDMPF